MTKIYYTLTLNNKDYALPLQLGKVQAGFPTIAEDFTEEKLDLNKYLIKHPAATFLVRATGDSMQDAGIYENDLLVVDRSLEATHNKVVIAVIDGYLTVKRLIYKNGKMLLIADNSAYPAIEFKPNSEAYIWGVVTNVIRNL